MQTEGEQFVRTELQELDLNNTGERSVESTQRQSGMDEGIALGTGKDKGDGDQSCWHGGEAEKRNEPELEEGATPGEFIHGWERARGEESGDDEEPLRRSRSSEPRWPMEEEGERGREKAGPREKRSKSSDSRESFESALDEQQTGSDSASAMEEKQGELEAQASPREVGAWGRVEAVPERPKSAPGERESFEERRRKVDPLGVWERSKAWEQVRRLKEHAKREVKEQEELKQCTFSPRVRESPSSRRSNGSPAFRRLASPSKGTHCKQHHDDQLTFKPKTNTARHPPDRVRQEADRTGTGAALLGGFSSSLGHQHQRPARPHSADVARSQHGHACAKEGAMAQETFRPHTNSARRPPEQIRQEAKQWDNAIYPPWWKATAAAGQGRSDADSQPEATKEHNWSARGSFLERQREALERKEHHRDELALSMYGSDYSPRISERSRKIASRARREPSKFSQQAEEAARRDLTFKPSITKLASRLQRRSSHQLAEGDRVARERRIEELRSEQEHLEREHAEQQRREVERLRRQAGRGATPAIKRPSYGLERYWRRREERERERINREKEREEEELANCTFTPRTRPVPAFVFSRAAAAKEAHESSTPRSTPSSHRSDALFGYSHRSHLLDPYS